MLFELGFLFILFLGIIFIIVLIYQIKENPLFRNVIFLKAKSKTLAETIDINELKNYSHDYKITLKKEQLQEYALIHSYYERIIPKYLPKRIRFLKYFENFNTTISLEHLAKGKIFTEELRSIPSENLVEDINSSLKNLLTDTERRNYNDIFNLNKTFALSNFLVKERNGNDSIETDSEKEKRETILEPLWTNKDIQNLNDREKFIKLIENITNDVGKGGLRNIRIEKDNWLKFEKEILDNKIKDSNTAYLWFYLTCLFQLIGESPLYHKEDKNVVRIKKKFMDSLVDICSKLKDGNMGDLALRLDDLTKLTFNYCNIEKMS